MFFSQDWIRGLLEKVDIRELVGEYVSLKQKGGRFWACCPFHHEKTPSFSVTPELGVYYCFGCHAGGDALHFVMQQENLSFAEACEYLAEKYHVELPEEGNGYTDAKNRSLREKILETNKECARFYHSALYSPKGKHALDYLHGRGFTDSVIRAFGMGYSYDNWTSAVDFLRGKGRSDEDILSAGIAKKKENRVYDLFRGRIMIPILDAFSNVIGFGGRVLDDTLPKYLNTPDTKAFNKSESLYNLNQIRKLKKQPYLILVEGYMDVIALAACGVMNAAATLGTALTKRQAHLIKRYADKVYISYDGDEAGQKAAYRAVDILKSEGAEPFVVEIPDHRDPDEYVKKYGREAYGQLLKSALPAMEYKFQTIERKCDITAPEGAEYYAKECAKLVKDVESAIEKERYLRMIAQKTGFSVASVAQDAQNAGDPKGNDWTPREKGKTEIGRDAAEDGVIRILCLYPEAIEKVKGRLFAGDFAYPPARNIFTYLSDRSNKGLRTASDEMLLSFQGEELSYAAELMSENDFAVQGEYDSALCDHIAKLDLKRLTEQKKLYLTEYEKQTDEKKKEQLLKMINRLDIQKHERKKELRRN